MELTHEIKMLKLWMVRTNKQLNSLEDKADAKQREIKYADETEQDREDNEQNNEKKFKCDYFGSSGKSKINLVKHINSKYGSTDKGRKEKYSGLYRWRLERHVQVCK